MANILEVLRHYDPQFDSGRGYPSTSDYRTKKGPNYEIDEIIGSGAPTAGTGHANAPLGSNYTNGDTGEQYKKSAAAGTDTWTIISTAI